MICLKIPHCAVLCYTALMKNRTVSCLYRAVAATSFSYFCALQALSPAVVSFSDVWLLFAAVCWLCAHGVKRRAAAAPYEFLPYAQKPLRLAAFVLLGAGSVAVAACLVRIASPIVNDGTVDTAYVIVLGGGVRSDGTISEVTRERLRSAARYLHAHPQSKAVVSGGKLRFVAYAEAPVLAQELALLGIAPERILQEGQAQDTIQNFVYSANLIAKREGIPVSDVLSMPVTVVTSSFHLARAEMLARRLGFTSVYGLGARIPAFYVPNTYCREICAYVKLCLCILLTRNPRPIGEAAQRMRMARKQ